MRQSFFTTIAICLLTACNTQTGTNTEADMKDTTASSATATPLTYAYTPTYTSDFEMGDPKYAQTVVELWKDYDNNTFENHSDAFADSVYMEFHDGSKFAGTRDSLLSMMKKFRTSLGTATSTVFAWTTLNAKTKDETWVCIWGKEIDEKNGKKDSLNLNENWMFNKDGKISFMTQYVQKYAKK